MAVNIIKSGTSTNMPTKEFVCDELEDLTNYDKTNLIMGSTCYVIAEQKRYVLNSSKEWIECSITIGNV